MKNKDFILYVRNFIFGAEDSLVSTVGLLAGIVSAGILQREVIISGVVLISVEAFSMSIGSFLSERTTEEYYPGFHKDKSKSIPAAFIMFFSYLFCGFVPLFPYLVVGRETAFWWSILASLLALFLLGFASAKILKTHLLKNAFRMMLIGGVAISLGVVVGMMIK